MELFINQLSSPIGPLTLVWDDGALRALDFDGFEERFQRLLASHYGDHQLKQAQIPAQYRRPLEDYFAGELTAVDAVPVRTGGTPFQQKVWAALREIPAGATMSYGELARNIGRPGASRAVGRANGTNPVGIIVPCHRVIGADGSLTGYGGGMDRKRWLLAHEQAHLLKLAG
jgi:O-6-methylguanine DNA methyltransferase